MTHNDSARHSYLQVLTDGQGNILAAAVRRTPAAQADARGTDEAPEVTINPADGQVLHQLSIPPGSAGDELLESLDRLMVRVDEGTPTLVPPS